MGKRTANLSGLSRHVLEALWSSSTEARSEGEGPSIVESAQPPLTQTSTNGDDRPTKRRRTGVINTDPTIYDATGLVPYYRHASEVPENLQKYFSQRKRYFSLYEKGCLLDEEGWYSVTPERVANQIAERCRCDTILDAFCGVGGNAIAFAKTCERVIALDTDPTRLALARHNAVIYGVADRIEFILSDYISFADSYLSLPLVGSRKIDIVFLSPPWGGPSYLSGSAAEAAEATVPVPANQLSHQTQLVPPIEAHPEYSLASIQPLHGAELFKLSRRITQNIAYFLPRNTNLHEVAALLPDEVAQGNMRGEDKLHGDADSEVVEVEEEWMGTKLKALTCYFGGLVGGQEHLY